MNTFEILWKYRQGFTLGLLVSVKLVVCVWSIGIPCGILLGVAAARLQKTVGIIVGAVGAIMTSIPIIVLLFWLHYPLQAALKIVINPFYTSVAALSVVNLFGVAAIVRSALLDFPSQYVMSARVCGLRKRVVVARIVLPLLVRQLLPGLLLLQVTMLQATLFASLISVDEVFRVAQRVNSIEYRPIQIYTALAILFVCVCLPLNVLAHWLGKRFAVFTSDQ
jgi:polar amino acid transport system permease protein